MKEQSRPFSTLISICIPAYKRIDFLNRLLDSISVQTFRDFEVIVTDDSPDTEVGGLCKEYEGRFPLYYFRNEHVLGTPENWNEAIRRSAGKWIKIMHDDDWFTDENSLAEFARAVSGHPESSFIFSAYRDVFLERNSSREMFINKFRYKALLKDSTSLFSQNVIGPPSVVMYKKQEGIFFDPTVKWVVDIDFYIRYLAQATPDGSRFRDARPVYIHKVLIQVGIGNQQVTCDCFGLRLVEIPENFYLLDKVGVRHLRNILVYDAWWRLMRNLEIRNGEDIPNSGYSGPIPAVILSMIGLQARFPLKILRMGPISKTLMFLHYITHYFRIAA